ncbi:hypothetical protein EK0264_10710 [Epidermidibacterium keratini]|uniref:Uncharacterized protein n=1 Tax=Epidermidibacterium keratini TaxID=1891644 RepID=A0A7L4YP88_9ACTN|nr:hypothetical protein [Epidermidibacterium keratini]QHC00713.1 hypothetical protein EK0264_10710 [Epidermidibacterium keratini]
MTVHTPDDPDGSGIAIVPQDIPLPSKTAEPAWVNVAEPFSALTVHVPSRALTPVIADTTSRAALAGFQVALVI